MTHGNKTDSRPRPEVKSYKKAESKKPEFKIRLHLITDFQEDKTAIRSHDVEWPFPFLPRKDETIDESLLRKLISDTTTFNHFTSQTLTWTVVSIEWAWYGDARRQPLIPELLIEGQ